jgi:hypothetical protein
MTDQSLPEWRSTQRAPVSQEMAEFGAVQFIGHFISIRFDSAATGWCGLEQWRAGPRARGGTIEPHIFHALGLFG